MGGSGSGRHSHYVHKDLTSNYLSIDVRHWQQKGILVKPGAYGLQYSRGGKEVASLRICIEPGKVTLNYWYMRDNQDWQEMNYPIMLDWSSCNYGGKRAWFRCPAPGCGRRVAILYRKHNFACRHCHKLAYPSQRESDYDRIVSSVNKIRDRLGWTLEMTKRNEMIKPKGMHWKTYIRLLKQYEELIAQSTKVFKGQMEAIYGKVFSER